MKIEEKYYNIRPMIKDGDLVLFRGTKLLAKIIQHADRDKVTKKPAYFNHIGIVMAVHGSLFIVDSQSNGIEADRLSERISDYKNGDFCVIQSKNDTNTADEMTKLFARQDMKDVLYDYGNGFKELLNRRFGWNLKIEPKEDKDICSDFVYEYALRMGMIVPFENRVAFPMDYIRYRDKDKTRIIGF